MRMVKLAAFSLCRFASSRARCVCTPTHAAKPHSDFMLLLCCCVAALLCCCVAVLLCCCVAVLLWYHHTKQPQTKMVIQAVFNTCTSPMRCVVCRGSAAGRSAPQFVRRWIRQDRSLRRKSKASARVLGSDVSVVDAALSLD